MANNDNKRTDRMLYSSSTKYKLRLRAGRNIIVPDDSGFAKEAPLKKALTLDFDTFPVPIKTTISQNGVVARNVPVNRDVGVANFDQQFNKWEKAGWVQPGEREGLWKEATSGPGFGSDYGTRDMVDRLQYSPMGAPQGGSVKTVVDFDASATAKVA
jgi:hypothetical protein